MKSSLTTKAEGAPAVRWRQPGKAILPTEPLTSTTRRSLRSNTCCDMRPPANGSKALPMRSVWWASRWAGRMGGRWGGCSGPARHVGRLLRRPSWPRSRRRHRLGASLTSLSCTSGLPRWASAWAGWSAGASGPWASWWGSWWGNDWAIGWGFGWARAMGTHSRKAWRWPRT